MLVSPNSESTTPAHNQSSAPPPSDLRAHLSVAQREIEELRRLRAQDAEVVANQQKVIAGQRDQLTAAETFRQNVLKERTFLRRGDIDPTTKLTLVIAAWEMGTTFGNDNVERQEKYKPVTAEKVAEQVGVSKAVVLDRINAATTPTEGFTPLFEKKRVWHKNKDTGLPYSVTHLAPPEGKMWLDTWGADPKEMVAPPATVRRAKDTASRRARVAEERTVVAEARRILAQCPACGSLDVSLVCHSCGTKTPAAEAIAAPPCEEARPPVDVDSTSTGNDAATPRAEHDMSMAGVPDDDAYARWSAEQERIHDAAGEAIDAGRGGRPRRPGGTAPKKAALAAGRPSTAVHYTVTPEQVAPVAVDSSSTQEEPEAPYGFVDLRDIGNEDSPYISVGTHSDENRHDVEAPADPSSCVTVDSTSTDDPPPDDPPPAVLEETAISRTAHEVAHLVGGDWSLACVLGRAANTIMEAVGQFPNHVVMQRRATEQGNKYLTRSEPLTHLPVAQHLVGTMTLGAGLLTSDDEAGEPRACRAVAYDSDKGFSALVAAAKKIAHYGLSPLLVRNDAKRASGHLWLFFDRDVDPAEVFKTLETWAPVLKQVQERFPAPNVRGGHRLRLPGGCYLPAGLDPVPVQVALAPAEGEGEVEWVDALSPEGWVLIGAAVSDPDAIEHAWIPPAQRATPAPPPKKAQAPRPAAPAGNGTGSIDDAVARFNLERPVRSMVDVNRAGMFHSPWHVDATPSCKVYDDEDRWTDFSRDRRGGDALSLYCALNGLWNLTDDKADRLKALRQLGYLSERKDGYHPELRGDDLLVRLTISDRGKWQRAKDSFRKAFPGARFSSEDKAWILPAAQSAAAAAWAREFAASEARS